MNMRKMKDLIRLSIGMDQTIIYRPPDKSVYLKIILLISQSKHMLWVLKRKSAMRGSFKLPKYMFKPIGKKIITILHSKICLSNIETGL